MQIFRHALLFLLLAASSSPAQRLSPLAPRPDWGSLDKYQRTITRDEFARLLTQVFAPNGAWQGWFDIGPDHVNVVTSPGKPPFRLDFAAEGAAEPVPRYWRGGKSLHGLRVAIDPGHLGGPWARMEERWFQIGDGKPVVEGDMTLAVARHLKRELEARGAKVYLVRDSAKPATPLRPEKLRKAAAASLQDQRRAVTPRAVQAESERLFYRTAEIRARAKKVNGSIKPDLVLALHFNAEAWGNPARPTLVSANHMHLLVSGCLSANELSYEDQRHDLMAKLLSRSSAEEIAVARAVAASMARATGLPPYTYSSGAAINAGSPYVWARNLLANRLYECPVVYLEPYVMNNRDVHARVQAGDYKGRRSVAGASRESLYREYARGVAQGVAARYGTD